MRTRPLRRSPFAVGPFERRNGRTIERRTSASALLRRASSGLALIAAFLCQDPDPAAEYATRIKGAPALAAKKLVQAGDFLAEKGLHGTAREQFVRAAQADPNSDEAHKRLGEKRGEEGGWEVDLELSRKIKTVNEPKKDDDLLKIRVDFLKRLAEAEKAIGAEWTAIGNLAEKAGMKAEAEAAWRRAIEFAPGHEAARKKLGYEKREERWVLPAERQSRDSLERDVAKAPGGAEDAGKSEAGEKTGIKLLRRSSDHFLLESSYLDAKGLTDLVQRSEHTYAAFHRIFAQTDLWKGAKYNLVIVKDKPEHEKFVDAFHAGSKEQKDFSKKQTGWGNFPLRDATCGERPAISAQDFCIHYTAQALAGAMAANRAIWVVEGLALWFSSGVQDTANWACVDMAGTGAGGGGRNNRDPKNWPVIIKTWIAEGKDPDVVALVKCTKWSEFDGGEAIKAWSLLDFLMIEHKAKLVEFLVDLRSQKDTGEASLQKVFGWTLADLDTRWRTWARATFEAAK